jgi:hypothetical protein
MNMWVKCWPSRSGNLSRACEEYVEPEYQLKDEGESLCDGELVWDSWRNGEPDCFIASAEQ